VNARDKRGVTPLWAAARYRCASYEDVAFNRSRPVACTWEGAIQHLIAYRADVNVADSFEGRSVLHHLATRDSCVELMQWLIEEKQLDINIRDFNDDTPLHEAVKAGQVEMVKMLLKKGAKLDNRGSKGQTRKFSCIIRLNVQLCMLLWRKKSTLIIPSLKVYSGMLLCCNHQSQILLSM
jgi:ankyrin repeat protein